MGPRAFAWGALQPFLCRSEPCGLAGGESWRRPGKGREGGFAGAECAECGRSCLGLRGPLGFRGARGRRQGPIQPVTCCGPGPGPRVCALIREREGLGGRV